MDIKDYVKALVAGGVSGQQLVELIDKFDAQTLAAASASSAENSASVETESAAVANSGANAPAVDYQPLLDAISAFGTKVEGLTQKMDNLVGYQAPPSSEQIAEDAIASVLYATDFKI